MRTLPLPVDPFAIDKEPLTTQNTSIPAIHRDSAHIRGLSSKQHTNPLQLQLHTQGLSAEASPELGCRGPWAAALEAAAAPTAHPPSRAQERALKKVQPALGSDLFGIRRNKAVFVPLTLCRCIKHRPFPLTQGFSGSAVQGAWFLTSHSLSLSLSLSLIHTHTQYHSRVRRATETPIPSCAANSTQFPGK